MSKRRTGIRQYSRYFPLDSVAGVVELFRSQIVESATPDLALMSIILGAVETRLTGEATSSEELATTEDRDDKIPAIQFADVESLYQRFASLLRNYVQAGELAACRRGKLTVTTRDVVKKVSDVVWSLLASNYHKDRAHIQSLYSLMTGNKLDCFGVAMCAVAGCQLLNLDDVHLAMSEDHVWVVFGEDGSETAEVTWHGKAFEDKRGQSVRSGTVDRSWLYLSGHAVVCSRYMELAALVSSINPSISSIADSPQLSLLQQHLMWLLYDGGHLEKYPIAVSSIGDIEELNPTTGHPPPLVLYRKAIESAKLHYANMHVYPYTYLGAYFYRHRRFRSALSAWADAADVISRYNYSRDDEEVYKEFLEIANEIIPQILRMEQEHAKPSSSLLGDATAYLLLLKFYDGLCCWEEGSNTPVLHITWATHMLSSLGKFDNAARTSVELVDFSEDKSDEDKTVVTSVDLNANEQEKRAKPSTVRTRRNGGKRSHRNDSKQMLSSPASSSSGCEYDTKGLLGMAKKCSVVVDAKDFVSRDTLQKYKDDVYDATDWRQLSVSDDDKMKLAMEQLVTDSEDDGDDRNSEIVALAHACGESLLNPDFLRGNSNGEPFVKGSENQLFSVATNTQMDLNLFANVCVEPIPNIGTVSSSVKDSGVTNTVDNESLFPRLSSGDADAKCQRPRLELRSAKMKTIKELLVAEKLNSSAITLQLTAQSQVHVKRGRSYPARLADCKWVKQARRK